jgi:hypothetical protein
MIAAEETEYAEDADFLTRLSLASVDLTHTERRADPWSVAGSDSATPPSEGISGGRAGVVIHARVAKAVSPLVPRSATALQGARLIPLASFRPIHGPVSRDSTSPRHPLPPQQLK